MFCAISEDQQLRFLRKVTGEISAAQKAGKPFDVDQYIVDVYEEIRTKTGDAVKAYTYAAYIPKNIISIVAESSDIRKYFKGKMDGVADLADQFEDYETVRLHISGIVGVQKAQPVETPPIDYIEPDIEPTTVQQPTQQDAKAEIENNDFVIKIKKIARSYAGGKQFVNTKQTGKEFLEQVNYGMYGEKVQAEHLLYFKDKFGGALYDLINRGYKELTGKTFEEYDAELAALEQANAAPSVEVGATDLEKKLGIVLSNEEIEAVPYWSREKSQMKEFYDKKGLLTDLGRRLTPIVESVGKKIAESIAKKLEFKLEDVRVPNNLGGLDVIKQYQTKEGKPIGDYEQVVYNYFDAKYDAELAALEQPTQQTSEVKADVTQSKQFTPLGRSNLTTVGFEFTKQGEKDMDPVSVGSFAFIRQYDAAREDGVQTDPQMQKVRLKVVTAKSIFDELSESDKAYEAASETSGVKVIATIDGQPIRVNSDGIISEEGVIPQWNITKPIFNNGVYSRQNETPAEEIAAEFGLTLEEVVRQRQKEYSILDKLRNAILANPSKDIYLDITSASTGFINKNYREPSALSSIDFGKLGTRFTPFVKTTGPNKGYAYFTLATSNIEFNIDRPPVSEVIDVRTLAKYMADVNVPLEVRREIVDSIVYLKDFKITQDGVMFMGQLVTEDAIVGTITRSTAPGGTNAIRANIPKAQIESNSDMQIPYYENDVVQYRSIPVKDYLIKYFNTPYELDGRYKKGSPFLTFNVPNNEQLAITEFLETTESLPEGTSRIASTPTGVSFKIDSASILDDLANTLKADVAERGVGDVFNLPLELGERLDDNVDNRTDQNCK